MNFPVVDGQEFILFTAPWIENAIDLRVANYESEYRTLISRYTEEGWIDRSINGLTVDDINDDIAANVPEWGGVDPTFPGAFFLDGVTQIVPTSWAAGTTPTFKYQWMDYIQSETWSLNQGLLYGTFLAFQGQKFTIGYTGRKPNAH